jgi:ATP-dependent RNA helicase DOB1
VVDERGVFREDNFQKAVAALTETAADGKGMGAKKGEGKKDSKQVGN